MLDGVSSRRPNPMNKRPGMRPSEHQRQDGDQPLSGNGQPSGSRRDGKKSSRKLSKVATVICILVVLVVAGWFAWSSVKDSNVGIDSSKYQAVFLADGKVFFGKLEIISGHNMRLSQVFYPESEEPVAGTSEEEADSPEAGTTKLVPFKDNIYGPEDEIVIDRNQVTFFMNLRPDTGAGKLIEDYIKEN